jgi:transcriptional regulator with XRE-family HTH domain
MSKEFKVKNAGEYLRLKRTEKGLTLQELSDSTNFNLSLLSKIERGERSLSLDMVPSLSSALQIPFKQAQTDFLSFKVAEVFGEEEFAQAGIKQALDLI